MMLIALLLSSTSYAAALGNPAVSAEEGHVRLGVVFSGEVPPGAAPELPAKGLRLDLVPVDQIGVFADGNWTNSLEDVVGGVRRRVWQVGAGARLSVYPTRFIGFGVIGRFSYGRDWLVQPFYLMADGSSTDVIPSTASTPTTTTSGAPDEADDAAASTTSGGNPIFPAWARGVRTDEAQRLSGRTVAAMTIGAPGGGIYAWTGAHFSVNGVQQVGAVLGDGASWQWSVNKRPVGGTFGFEAMSSDILGWGDVRDRWLSAGIEVHIIDATGAAVWVSYAW